MALLSISILALAVGPLVFQVFALSRKWLRLLDGFLFVAVGWIACGEILPGAMERAGPLVLLSMMMGLVLPFLAERLFHHQKVHRAAALAAMAGLFLHALTDGAWLAHADQGFGVHLAAGVLIHRIPMGLAIWWIVRPNFGVSAALWMLGTIACGSVLGFSLGQNLEQGFTSFWLEHFQSLVAGSLLHVMIHPSGSHDHSHESHHSDHHDHCCPSQAHQPWYEGAGNILAVIFLLSLGHWQNFAFNGGHSDHGHDHGSIDIWPAFLELALDTAPALLLAYAIGGFATIFLKDSYMNWLGQGRTWQQSLKGILIGLPLPICSCGVVPLYQTLIKKGAPPSAAIAFLIATPELGIDAILISIPLLDVPMTLLRLLGALVVAFAVAIIVGTLIAREQKPTKDDQVKVTSSSSSKPKSWQENMRAGLKEGFVDLVDHTGPWILFGLFLASAIGPVLNTHYQDIAGQPWEVLIFALLGLPIYVCASGATPLVAVFLANGVSPGAALAFLLTGPATNITTYGVVAKLHGRRAAVALGACAALASMVLGYVVNAYLGDISRPSQGVESHEHGWLSYGSLAILAVVFGISAFKQGARSYLREVFIPHHH
ncbi:permease [Pseudobacteriovorax antillogorgiicola]|uniref:Uncharacterized membrane protein YraQ, UPF0718 family n=1 Tax=Pseudobacteriovorax antillogorgiicola TaxID=1513793 RepID=A0A1Y6C989_9BACT|nr:permease [Pseudobacteriovorax antillogorgiicola]TCS49799.1 uncharacterized membrane protein YraQ (UPF0718 family) [Pseudobacteriovorax antillogorgiicola]SMF43017.1 Uncharacterized membrane protein YraQ, UPF0718 family [Pseudobacteriovorax antillogorgiicola]